MSFFTSLSDAEFGALFVNFHISAFRLETLQRYAVAYEEAPFFDFQAGRERYTSREQAEWASLIRRNISAGKSMSRVHIVMEPLSEYIRFELLWPYLDSVEAGEDVRILPIGNEWPADLPKQDFWLFDSKQAAVMHYDDSGRFTRAEMTNDPIQITDFIEQKDRVLGTSMTYNDYIKKVRLK